MGADKADRGAELRKDLHYGDVSTVILCFVPPEFILTAKIFSQLSPVLSLETFFAPATGRLQVGLRACAAALRHHHGGGAYELLRLLAT